MTIPEAAGPARQLRHARPAERQATDSRVAGPVLRWYARTGRRAARQLAVLACYLAAGVAVTWPLATSLGGKMIPNVHDPASYLWSLWWVAHQVTHLSNPWFTGWMAAPVGIPLGYDTLLPLAGLVMTPVTLTMGPAVSYNLLVVLMPGLLCYAMYRAARLWIRPETGAIAAGAFFGLATMTTWQDWYHLNIAAGELFLPLVLEASVRLQRSPGLRRALILGFVLGAAVLVNQESAVMAGALAALVLLTWLLRSPSLVTLRACALSLLAAAVVASPQLAAMLQQRKAGDAYAPAHTLAAWYPRLVAGLPALFSPSPRLQYWGLGRFASGSAVVRGDGIPDFGAALTVLAVLGLVVSWRRLSARLLALLWLGSAALAMGPVATVGGHKYVLLATSLDGVRMSAALPFTWLVQLPGLADFREAERFSLLGLVPAALLAGAAVSWLAARARPILTGQARLRSACAVAALAVLIPLAALEAGWSGSPGPALIPVSRPALDRPIAADRSGSIVVDVPFGLRGGLPWYFGGRMMPEAIAMAPEDGHPRAISYTSWVPIPVMKAMHSHPFYARLVAAQLGRPSTPAQITAARGDVGQMHIGWVLVWQPVPAVLRYLKQIGFHFDYRADGVLVYRPRVS